MFVRPRLDDPTVDEAWAHTEALFGTVRLIVKKGRSIVWILGLHVDRSLQCFVFKNDANKIMRS